MEFASPNEWKNGTLLITIWLAVDVDPDDITMLPLLITKLPLDAVILPLEAVNVVALVIEPALV
jgi:hypothetical protein